MYPEFEALKKTPTRYFKEGRKFQEIRFLIKDASSYAMSINDKIESTKKRLTGADYQGKFYELKKYSQMPPRDYELFVHEENDNPIGYIRCSRDEVATNPQCTGKIEKYGTWLTISFDRDFLESWPDIRDRGFALIESFIVGK